jgi:elongation factor P hydroxylase
MKKLVLLFAVLLFAAGAYSQKAVMANYTDTITDADIHYYTVKAVLSKNYAYTFQFYLDHITGSADSTTVIFQGSIDGTTWYKIDAGIPTTATIIWRYANAFLKMATTDGSAMYFPTNYISYPYLRAKVQHYETGTVRVKGWVYLKEK